jgi:hypothetical protein
MSDEKQFHVTLYVDYTTERHNALRTKSHIDLIRDLRTDFSVLRLSQPPRDNVILLQDLQVKVWWILDQRASVRSLKTLDMH